MKIEKKPINNPINNPTKNASENLKNISSHLKNNKTLKRKFENPIAPISNQIDQNIISDIKDILRFMTTKRKSSHIDVYFHLISLKDKAMTNETKNLVEETILYLDSTVIRGS